MNSGVYQIKNIVNNKIYIGSSKNIKKRFGNHKWSLRKLRHDNILLQNSWNKYGENVFEFSILEVCEIHILIEREQYYLDLHKPFDRMVGYNLCPIAYSTSGYKYSEESKEKIKIAVKAAKSKLGKQILTKKHKLDISLSNRGDGNGMSQITKDIVLLIRKDYENNLTYKDLMKKYDLNYGLIYKVVNRLRWNWL